MPSQPRRSARGPLAVLGTLVLASTMLGPALPGAQADPVAPAPVLDAVGGAPDRIVVRWKDSATTTGRAKARSAASTLPGPRLGDPDFELVRPRAGQSVADAVRELRADPRVAAADPDRYLSPLGMPDDPDLPKQWALQPDSPTTSADGSSTASGGIDVGPAWDRSVGKPSTVVAVIDGGLDLGVPDLASVVWTNAVEVPGNGVDDDGNGFVDDVHGWDFVGRDAEHPAGDADPSDDDPVGGGHGSHVAGILGARGNDGAGITGVAQDVRIMPLRVCTRSPSLAANRCLLSAIVQAVNYAGSNGARVANLSLGGGQYDQVLADALASNPRTLFVVAAGNDGRDNEKHPIYPCSYDPVRDSKVAGRTDNLVCVAALDQQGRPASFSNWGVQDVDLAAPGVDIWSVYRKYESQSVWKDDFEGGDYASRWAGDPGFGTAAAGDGPLVSTGLTDSPGTAPIAGEHHLRSATFPVPAAAEYCAVRGERFAKLTDSTDLSYSLWADGAEAPTSYSLAVTWTKRELKTFSTDVFDASTLAGKQVSLHLDYTAPDGLDASYGVWLDNLEVTCGHVVEPAPYAYLQGTSMASPMVAGAAALLFSLKPDAGVAQVKAAVLGGAHRLTAWTGRTVTGGRLDVAAAMGRLVPPGTKFLGISTAGRSVSINAVQDGDLPGVRFQCRIDTRSWLQCNPRGVVRGLHPGKHVFFVRAVDPYGNADRTPAAASFTITGCLVPRLAGTTPVRARALLLRAGCRVGVVTRKHGVPFRKLRVRATYPQAGWYGTTTGTPVRIVLGR